MTEFRYNDAEAEITAKWQLNVRNTTSYVTYAMVAAIALIEFVKQLLNLQLPTVAVLTCYAAAVALFLLTLSFVENRVRAVASAIKAQEFGVSFDNDVITVTNGGSEIFKAAYSDVKEIRIGVNTVRFKSEFDAVCIPRRLVSGELLTQFSDSLGAGYKTVKWM